MSARVRRAQHGIYHVVTLTDPYGQVWSSAPGYRHEREFLSERDAKIFQSNAHASIARARRTAINSPTALLAA